jgi:hypothetical protein
MLDLSRQIDMVAATFDNLDQDHRSGSKGRLHSLSLFGSPAAPRYAAAWENGVIDVNYSCRSATTILADGRQVHGSLG